MPEAVIVAAARSPIGRAVKGSLASIRPDDLTVQIVRAALDQVPQLDPADIDDLMLGCGLPGGEQGFNMARVVAVLLGYDAAARHHGHPVLLVVAADHPDGHARDPGRRGRRVHLGGRGDRVPVRQGQLRLAGRTPATRCSPTPPTRSTADRRARARTTWNDPRDGRARCPTSTSRWARPRRTWPCSRASAARTWTTSACARRTWPRSRSPTGSSPARSPRSRCPTAPWSAADDGPRAGVTYEAVAALKPVFRPDGRVTAGNCCPLNDGAAALVVMSDTQGRRAGHHAAGPGRLHRRLRRCRRRSWGSGPVEASKQALARAGMTIDDIDLVEINEAFAAQVLPSARDLGIDEDKLNVNGGAIALGPPVRHDRRADRHHADQRRCARTTRPSAWRRCASAAARAWRWCSSG